MKTGEELKKTGERFLRFKGKTDRKKQQVGLFYHFSPVTDFSPVTEIFTGDRIFPYFEHGRPTSGENFTNSKKTALQMD